MKKNKETKRIERAATTATKWLGSTSSLIFHTCMFVVFFILIISGLNFVKIMLILNTIVSLEAIYMNIFIQMAVNKNTADLEDIAEDVEDIAEDVEDIQEDVGEIAEDVEDLQEEDAVN